MEDEYGCMYMMDLMTRVVSSEVEAFDLFFVGDSNWVVVEMLLNMVFSWLYCIFIIIIMWWLCGVDMLCWVKLNLVDLVGSERVNKSRVDGATL